MVDRYSVIYLSLCFCATIFGMELGLGLARTREGVFCMRGCHCLKRECCG